MAVLTIGDFARYGQVSVRMLRHYDETGLLKPAHVDPTTGYRSYSASQLARLNRLVALKELGFTLRQVRQLLDDEVSAEQLRGMLRLREAEIENQIAASEARLADVRARLALIAEESACADVVLKTDPGRQGRGAIRDRQEHGPGLHRPGGAGPVRRTRLCARNRSGATDRAWHRLLHRRRG
jgi:DNA-binding transcriptional MerR regulator